MTNAATFDVLRSLAFTSITSSYVAVGSSFANVVRVMLLTNNTNGDMLVSIDAVNDYLIVPANSFVLFDFSTNTARINSEFAFPIGTQIYVKQSTAPTSGAFYVATVYAVGE